MPGPKFIKRIRISTLNSVIYSSLTPLLGFFWVLSLGSKQKIRI